MEDNSAKEWVKNKNRYPYAVSVYKDQWDNNHKCFYKVYTIYRTSEIDAWTAKDNVLGHGYSAEEAWEDAKYFIKTIEKK